MFAQCAITLTNAYTDVAQTAAAQGDSDMQTLAAKAVRQAIERWNNHHLWNFLLVESPTMAADATLGGDYILPADFGHVYDIKSLTGTQRVFRPLTQREYDWMDPYAQPGTATFYGLFNSGSTGYLRMYPTPSAAFTYIMRYYRRMNIPMQSVAVTGCTTSASNVSVAGSSITNGSDVLTLGTATATGIWPGMVIAGNAGIPSGTTVLYQMSTTTIKMSAAATADATGVTATFGLSLLATSTAGGFNNVRLGAPIAGTPPTGLSTSMSVARIIDGTHLLLSSPSTQAVTSSSVTFDSSSALLDIPADYERAIMALAKYYFLTDKGGESERIQNWKQEADMGLIEAKQKDSIVPDDLLSFQPGYLAPQTYYPLNPNDVRWSWVGEW